MKSNPRLLGLAFASADILFELDQKGRIAFAVGSPPDPDCPAPEAWTGRRLSDCMDLASEAAFSIAIAGLAVGERSSAVDILLAGSPGRLRRARIRAFRLPELGPSLSCAIDFDGPSFASGDLAAPPLLQGDAFLERARVTLDPATRPPSLALSFVDVSGKGEVGPDHLGRVAACIEAVLQAGSVDGGSAMRLTLERFALLGNPADARDLAAEIRDAGAADGLDLAVRASQALIPSDADASSILKALRFAIEACLRNEPLDHPERLFSETLKSTLEAADRFRVMVKARQFDLHYQPIVELQTGMVHHFEALARFGGEVPATAIGMAEDLGLIEAFDLAVIEKALHKIRQPGNGLMKVAVNVSAASLASDAYLNAVLRLTAREPADRRRLTIEVTETVALQDLEAADRRLRALRASGVKVSIDDFGSGSASFDYLRRLSVDSVKIDGRFIRELDADGRACTVVRHLVDLCGSLNLTTVAEMVETESVAEIVRGLGVDFGQGWLFGRPSAEPQGAAYVPVTPARRTGVSTSWR